MEPHHGLTMLDYTVFGIILLSGLLALMRGLVREMFSLAAWVIAYYVAANYYKPLEPWAQSHVSSPTLAALLAAGILFVIVFVIISIIGYMFAKLVRGRALTMVDRGLGLAFGLLRGALIVCLVYLGATYVPWLNMDKLEAPNSAERVPTETAADDHTKPPEWLLYSKTRPMIAHGAKELRVFIPEKEVEDAMHEYDEQKSAAHKAVDDQTQDILSNVRTKASGGGAHEQTSYDGKSRSYLDQLLGQKNPQ